MKDFFDRAYYPLLERTEGLPYALYVRAGNDGRGTVRAVERIVAETELKISPNDYAKFNYSLAVLAVNMRSTFDLVQRPQAERLFTLLQSLLRKNFNDDKAYHAVTNTLTKSIEAYNSGILKIRNPLQDVAMLLYYKIGMQNTEQQVVDESYYVPEPKLVEYLMNSLALFTGKWEMLLEKYELSTPSGRAPMDS